MKKTTNQKWFMLWPTLIVGLAIYIWGQFQHPSAITQPQSPLSNQPTTVVKEITLTTNWSEPTEFIQDNWSYGSRVIRGNFKMLYVCDADEPGMEPIPIKYGEVFEPKMRMHRIKWRVDADQPVIMKYWVTKDSP